MQITNTKRPNAEVSLSGVLSTSQIEKHWEAAVTAVSKEIALPGFRKGHVPRERLIQEFGEKALWREAAERALKDDLEEILKKEDVHPIAPLGLSLASVAKGADVSFEITAIVAPSVTLGDYRALAKKALAAIPTDDAEKEKSEAKKAFGTQLAAMLGMSDIGSHSFLDDDAKKIGFESAVALATFMDEQAAHAVADRTMQKRRGAVAEALIKDATTEIPTLLVTDEAGALLDATKKDIAAQGMQWNDYLKQVKKTEEQVRDGLAPQAQKRIALDLIFGEIIKKEGLKLEGEDAKKAEDDLAHRIAHQGVDHAAAHQYARESLLREKVWEVIGVKHETSHAH